MTNIQPSYELTDTQRREELARLLPLWPNEISDLSLSGRRHIVRILERALRTERLRGRSGHWAYDLARHAALVATWRTELSALRAIERASRRSRQKSPPKGGRF